MGYLKNKTFGFYLSFVAAILALIGFVMYRQSGHTESYIEVLLLVTVVLQILAMIVLKVDKPSAYCKCNSDCSSTC